MTLERCRERRFPRLNRGEYRVTSPATGQYNCIAWAAGDDTCWWSPNPEDYWPAAVPREASVASFRAVFESLGYSECANAELDPGFEKIAVFARGDLPTHAARQLENGSWTSKLGEWQDIEHQFLDGLSDPIEYGEVVLLLRRPRNPD